MTHGFRLLYMSVDECVTFSRLHVKWENKDMVIMEDVRICSPYHSDSVTGGTRAANDRIKKVVSVNATKVINGTSLHFTADDINIVLFHS